MKRLISLLLILAVALGVLASCDNDSIVPGDSENGDSENGGGEKGEGDGMAEYIPYAEVLAVKGGASGIVVLQHDDGYFKTAVTMDRLLREYGLVADVCMLANRVWNASSDTPKASAIAQWRQILDTGRWKVVSHSLTHTWWGSATDNGDGSYNISDNAEKMTAEIALSQQMLREAFPDQRVLTFAYPGFTTEKNKYTDGTEEEILQYIYSSDSRELIGDTYIAGRRIQQAYSVTDTSIDWTMSGCYHIGGNYKSTYATKAGQNGTLTVLYVHNMVDVPEDQLKTYDYPSNTMASYYFEQTCKQVAAGIGSGAIWNTHYEDAVMYLREAQTATVTVSGGRGGLTVILTDEMEDSVYNYPLTVRISAPKEWEAVRIAQGDRISYARVFSSGDGYSFDADIVPDGASVQITPAHVSEIPVEEDTEPAPTPTLPEDIVIAPSDSFEGIRDGNFGTGAVTVGGIDLCHHIQDSVTAVGSIVTESGNKYLHISKSAVDGSGQNWLNMVRHGSESDCGVVFEARLRFDFLNSSPIYFRFYKGRTATGNGGTAHEPTAHMIKASGENLYFAESDLGVKCGEWFTLRAVIAADGTLTVYTMADGDDTFVACFTQSGYVDFVGADGVTIITSSKCLVAFDIDDISFTAQEREDTEEPENPDTGSDSDAPRTFENVPEGDIGTGAVSADGVTIGHHAQTNAVAICTVVAEGENKYLHLEKTAITGDSSSQNWLNIARDASDDRDRAGVVFEARMKLTFESSTQLCLRIYKGRNVTGSGGEAHELTADTLAAKGNSIYFKDIDLGVQAGEWFTLRAEIDTDGVFTLYIKNESDKPHITGGVEYMSGEFVPYYTQGGYEGFVNADCVSFVSFNKCLFTLDIDHITFTSKN